MNYTILYIEDDLDFAELIIAQLEQHHYQVVLASGGKIALDKFNSILPDLILLDILLPDFDGYTLAGLIRLSNPHVPIIMFTSLSNPADEIKGFQVGVNDYIRKEAEFDVLLARIEKELKRCPKSHTLIKLSEITSLDVTSKTLICGDKRQTLGMREFDLLCFFWHNLNTIHDRKVIQRTIWGANSNAKQYLYKTTALLKELLIDDPSLSIRSYRKAGIGLFIEADTELL